MDSPWVRVPLWCLAGYVVLCTVTYLFQRRLLYFPSREEMSTAIERARPLSLLPWQDDAGRFQGWLARHPNQPAAARALILHGNARTALEREYLVEVLQAPSQPVALDVILLEYPGYGPREGSPTERSLVDATVHALDDLHRTSEAAILLVGESLGSAVAALAAARRPNLVKGLLLLTPLSNLPAVARRHYPYLPTFLVRDTLRADRALTRLKLPVAFVLAGNDEVVFTDLGQRLFSSYAGPKFIHVEPGRTHNDLDYDPERPVWAEITRFLLGRQE